MVATVWHRSIWAEFKTQTYGVHWMINITLNGDMRSVSAGMTIAALAANIGLDPAKIAVERNREIVPRSTLADVILADGDVLEIVHFVGGG
jgi:thiamine biosynthesis protein ThiS